MLLLIPAYNEGRRLRVFLQDIITKNSSDLSNLDIIVLDDGSNDSEYRKMEDAVFELKEVFNLAGAKITYCRYDKNSGKGSVLRRAIFEKRHTYKYLGFLDADGSTKLSDWLRLISCLEQNPDLHAAFGSRIKALGYNVKRKFKRFLSGRIFATLLSEIFKIPVYDSQCGAKVFRSHALSDDALKFADDDRWLFDTQLLVYFYSTKLNMIEVPVNWEDCPGSKVSLIKDSLRMFFGLLRMKKRLDGWQL